MSGNPPRPGGPDDDLPLTISRLRATLGILELLAPFDKQERMQIAFGVLGGIDDEMMRLLNERMNKR
jgi:hypothetical protein